MTLGPNGTPWHSWRVLLLKYAPRPYSELLEAYRFDEPWDGPHNARLAGRIGEFYRRRGLDPDGTSQTSFVAIVGDGTVWPGTVSRSKSDILDGTSDTILVVEMANSGISWSEPRDLQLREMSLHVNDGTGRGPGSKVRGARALLASGRVIELADDFPPSSLRAMLTIAGGERVASP